MDENQLRESTLVDVSEEKVFVACRGDRVKNIWGLADCIEGLSPEEFAHHVSEERNDFSTWVHEVLENPNLAADLNHQVNLENQEHCVKTIRDHVTWLKNLQ